MAILFSQADGSDQHYDTYEEFEQAFILLKRLNGEKVPQDLLDEVSAKNSDKDHKPFQVKIDGNNFESAISEEVKKATRYLAEALDEVAENRTPVSDEGEDPKKASKFEVGDEVKVVNNLSNGHPEGTVGVIKSVSYFSDEGRHSYGVDSKLWSTHEITLHHYDSELESAKDSQTEFKAGDIVRATEDVVGFGGQYVSCNVGELLEVQIGGTGAMCLVKESWKCAYVSENLANIELVCRKEDRKDVEL